MQRVKLFYLILLLLVSSHSFAQEKTLSIAVGEWPPYITQDLKHKGVIAHLISDIFRDIGYRTTFNFYPWARAYKQAKSGNADLTGVWMFKQERAQDFLYSEPILSEEFVFFHHKSFDFNWHSIEDLKDLSLLGMIGYSYGPKLDKAIKSGLINVTHKASQTQQALAMLLQQRADIYPQEINIGYYELTKNFAKEKANQIIHHPTPYLINFSHVLFPKRIAASQPLLILFNMKLIEYKETGKYKAYFKRLSEGYYAVKAR